MIAIVTDSTSYISREMAQQLNVRIVPLSYTVAGQLFIESFPGENGQFEGLLERYGASAKTSQAPVAAYMSVFNELVRDGYEILCLSMSSRLSGTYSCACAAAKAVAENKIIVVDSLSTTYGMYLQILRAVEMIREGMALSDIARTIEKERDRIGIAFSVESLDALRRGGRLSFARQSISTILNVRPILMCANGVIVADGVVRGRSGIVRELVNKVPEGVKRIGIMHIRTPEIVASLIESLKQTHPTAIIEKWPVGPVIGIHLGLGAVGLGWMK